MRYGVRRKTFEERKCIHCLQSVEDECHVITQCPLYTHIRYPLFQYISSHVGHFEYMSDMEKMCFILGDTTLLFKTAKALYEMLELRRSLVLM